MKLSIIRIMSLLLALFMCLAAFVSCSKGDGEESGDGSGENAASTEISTDEAGERYDANGYLMDDLPETDLNAREFNILMWTEGESWEFVDTDAYPTALVDQVLCMREINVESRFNVQIEIYTQSCNWATKTAFIQHLANSINVNDQAYDIVGQYSAAAGDGVAQGLYHDLKTVEHVNIAKPWWPDKVVNSLAVNGKNFALIGDISPSFIRSAECMFVNLDHWENYDLETYSDGKTVYDLVKDNKWTLEILKVLALGHVGDNEGLADDQKMYGLAFRENITADGFLYAGGYTMVKDVGGTLALPSELETPAFSDWFDEIQELFSARNNDIYDDYGFQIFKNNRSLFYTGYVYEAQELAQNGNMFTVLPMPMRTEDQGSYYTCPTMGITLYTIPVDVKSTSESGLIMEALASEAYRTVSDTIYYDIFQVRYNTAGNENSAEMYDIIFDSIVIDVSRMFASELGSFASFRNAVIDSELSWSTVYAGQKSTFRANLIKLQAYIG